MAEFYFRCKKMITYCRVWIEKCVFVCSRTDIGYNRKKQLCFAGVSFLGNK